MKVYLGIYSSSSKVILIPSGCQRQRDLTAIATQIRQIQSDEQDTSVLSQVLNSFQLLNKWVFNP